MVYRGSMRYNLNHRRIMSPRTNNCGSMWPIKNHTGRMRHSMRSQLRMLNHRDRSSVNRCWEWKRVAIGNSNHWSSRNQWNYATHRTSEEGPGHQRDNTANMSTACHSTTDGSMELRW